MLDPWVLFPLSIIVSTTAMSSGLGGAVFFSPILMLFYDLSAGLAFTLGLFIEIFGFGSGILAYSRSKFIDYSLAFKMLKYAVPAVIIGVFASLFIPDSVIIPLFSVLLLFLGVSLLNPAKYIKKFSRTVIVKHEYARGCIQYRFPKREKDYLLFPSFGGFFVGLISFGIGELNEFMFLQKMKLHGRVAAGTSVFIVAVVALFGAVLRLLMSNDYEFALHVAIPLLTFAVPGVLIGGQLGMLISHRVENPENMKRFVGIIVVLIGALVLLTGRV